MRNLRWKSIKGACNSDEARNNRVKTVRMQEREARTAKDAHIYAQIIIFSALTLRQIIELSDTRAHRTNEQIFSFHCVTSK